MGRRALTTEEKAEKAARRRDRERQQRLVARQTKRTQPNEPHLPSQSLPETIPVNTIGPGMSLHRPSNHSYSTCLMLVFINRQL